MKRVIFLLILFIAAMAAAETGPGPVVSIYDEFDDGLFGKSIHRGVITSVKKAAFARSETLDVHPDEDGFLTAVVVSSDTVEKLMNGMYNLPIQMKRGVAIYTYNKEGLNISFSIEKAKDSMVQMVSDFYSNDEVWHDPLVEHYEENYVIRIHRAENVFDSWNEEITYNEAMVAATLIGDEDQWLWGIHNGSDILNKGY